VAKPKKQIKRRRPSGIGAALKKSLKEAAEWARGERILPVRTFHAPRRSRLPPK
jgi:hypothetical protein